MIVTDDMMHDAVAYTTEDPHPISEARYQLTVAENNAKTVYARLFLASEQSSDKRRDAEAVQDPDYLEAKAIEAVASRELEAHKQRIRSAETLVAIWQTENANARAAERVR